jgi:Septum formation
MTRADRDSTGEITDAGDVSAFSLEVGDCVSDLELSAAITSLPAVPCDEPHQAEVVGVFDLPEGEYPSEAELTSQADAGCANRLMLYAPTAVSDSSLQISYLYPLEQQWPTDREVVCFAVAASGTMTGSIAD